MIYPSIFLPTICSTWNESERLRPRETPCFCENLTSDQRRMKVLEAERELRHLRDRVRKAVAKLAAAQPKATTMKRSRASPRMTAGSAESNDIPLPRIDWQVTAERLADRLCFWRHGSALGRVGLTDCLKECGARKSDPPDSKRRLTLVWWGMERVLKEALEYCRPRPESDGRNRERLAPIRVCISDILPVYEWEVDCLRDRPRMKAHCWRTVQLEHWDYRRHCGDLTAEEIDWDDENETFLCTGGLDGFTSRPRRQVHRDDAHNMHPDFGSQGADSLSEPVAVRPAPSALEVSIPAPAVTRRRCSHNVFNHSLTTPNESNSESIVDDIPW